MFSEANPTRLLVAYDRETNFAYHQLAGRRLERGTLIQLQQSDGSWIAGVYEWDQPAWDLSFDTSKLPLFRLWLLNGLPNSQDPLSVEFFIPSDAVVRIDPRWRRIVNPRAPRKRDRK
jgi:hypothetical protein